jgi:hypothetical protein
VRTIAVRTPGVGALALTASGQRLVACYRSGWSFSELRPLSEDDLPQAIDLIDLTTGMDTDTDTGDHTPHRCRCAAVSTED